MRRINKESNKNIKKILVITGHGIGDVVTSIPTIDNLKYSFPDAKIDAINESAYGVGRLFLEKNKNIRNLINFDRSSFRSTLALLIKLSKEKYDLVFNCYPSTKKSALFSFMISRGIRAGIAENPWSFFFNITEESGKKHKIDIESQIIEKIGGRIKSKDVNLRLDLSISQKRISEILKKSKIKQFIIIAPGRIRADPRRWDSQNWVDVINYLISKKYPVLIVGSGSDKEIVDEVYTPFKGKKEVFNFCDKFSLFELAALIKKAALVLSVNTGIMNLSCALQAKTIGISGPSTYGWSAFGKNSIDLRGTFDYAECNGPCETHKRCSHLKCMKTITPTSVINAAKKVLKIK